MKQDFHFYASSIAEWRTGTDLVKLIKTMQSDDFEFVIYYVPLPADAPYNIKSYIPAVDDIVYLGTYNKKGKVDGVYFVGD